MNLWITYKFAETILSQPTMYISIADKNLLGFPIAPAMWKSVILLINSLLLTLDDR